MIARGLVLGGLLLVLGAVNLSIAEKERLVARGTTMLLELSADDARAQIQGDYLRLDYTLGRVHVAGVARDGRLVVRLDDRSVAAFVRIDDGMPLAPGEHLLRYRVRRDRMRLGSDAFYIQEGQEHRYAQARYGELRVDDEGTSVLVGLRDAEYGRIDGSL